MAKSTVINRRKVILEYFVIISLYEILSFLIANEVGKTQFES